jgi:hypothetical protein
MHLVIDLMNSEVEIYKGGRSGNSSLAILLAQVHVGWKFLFCDCPIDISFP